MKSSWPSITRSTYSASGPSPEFDAWERVSTATMVQLVRSACTPSLRHVPHCSENCLETSLVSAVFVKLPRHVTSEARCAV